HVRGRVPGRQGVAAGGQRRGHRVHGGHRGRALAHAPRLGRGEQGGIMADGGGGAPRMVEVKGKTVPEILAQIDLFAGLPPAHLRRFVEIGREQKHATGTTVFEEGAEGDRFFLVLEGAIRISRVVPGMGEEALAVLRPGAYFGEMSLIDDAPRSATALAHESTRLFSIARRDLEDLLFVDRDLAYDFLWNFLRTLSRRLRATNDKMTFLATTSKF